MINIEKSISIVYITAVHFKVKKNCQKIPTGTLNVFYILVIHTDNAQVIFVLTEVFQPGGAAINVSKNAQN